MSVFQELFPANRQNVEHFAKYFTDAGLKELSDFLRVQQSLGTRKELQKELQERLSQECPIKEVQKQIFASLAKVLRRKMADFSGHQCQQKR